MPLVRRKVVHEVGTTFSKIRTTITKYVSPTRVRHGDEVVAPTDRQLAELAALYPKEYGALAEKRGIEPIDLDALRAASGDDDIDPDYDPDLDLSADGDGATDLDEAQMTFLELSPKEAAAFLRDNAERRGFLAKLHAAESGQQKPRPAVMKAFKGLGIGNED